MATTLELISTITVGSGGAASIEFTSISGTAFTDLQIVLSGRSNRSLEVDGIDIQFNGVTTGYSGQRLYGSGSSAGADQTSQGMPFMAAATSTANTFGNAVIYIPNYAGSTNKTFSIDGAGENNATATYMGLGLRLWSNTAAITSVKLLPEAGSLLSQYSTASLYGILKGSGGATVS